MKLTQDQILSFVRWLISFGGGYAVGHGWITNDQVVLILGAAGPIVALVWSFIAHSQNAQVKAVENMPGVTKISVDPAKASETLLKIADDDNRQKVVEIKQ